LTGYAYLPDCIGSFEIPNARRISERSFTISNSQWLSDEAFESIFSTLKQTCLTGKSLPIA